jgi:phage replication O-like protein O
MANPQPDIFIGWSKELWKAIMKIRISGVPRKVFDAIGFLTYGANPRVKEAQITGKQIMELTGLDKKTVSKSLNQLLKMNLVTKNGDYWPPKLRINKDYDSWKESPKKANLANIKGLRKPPQKGVTNIGDRKSPKKATPKNPTFKYKRIKNTVDFLYNFYKTEISPLRKSSTRAKENISYYLKKYSFEDLKKSIENYKITIDGTDPQFRKDPANFFGKLDKYFLDYLPENFESPKDSIEQDTFYKELP